MTSVLFVSHDPDLRAVALRVLTMAGCSVTAAAHAGHASLACVENEAFDVLVVDGAMPDGCAQDIADRLRRYCPLARLVWLRDDGSAPVEDGITVVRPCTAYDLIGAVADASYYARRGATTL